MGGDRLGSGCLMTRTERLKKDRRSGRLARKRTLANCVIDGSLPKRDSAAINLLKQHIEAAVRSMWLNKLDERSCRKSDRFENGGK
jgi:hypothetical protein